MLAISFLANWKFILVLNLVIIIFYIKKTPREVLAIVVSSLSELIVIEPLKRIVAEPRPLNQIWETSYSFPSGHSYTAVVVYGLLTYLLWRKKRNRRLLIFGGLICGLIAVSRLYLGVHFWWDVVGGLCLGIVWLTSTLYILK